MAVWSEQELAYAIEAGAELFMNEIITGKGVVCKGLLLLWLFAG